MDKELGDEFLNVRETARSLSVHENTIRNWARDGLLPDARIPGSRFLRFRRADVERLRDQRGRPAASLQAERSTIGPELIDASQLARWADTRQAQEQFPELIRRLLAATSGITCIGIRAGEGVALEGWDGVAESAGTSFLPKGILLFEMGVNRRVKQKADQDWKARIESADPKATFVFATPRRWSGLHDWVKDRRKEAKFKDVRVIDADVLESWLQATPAVHHWISEQLGRHPEAARTIEAWWKQFSASTDPGLPPDMFIAGRSAQAEQLRAFLVNSPSSIVLRAEWDKDVHAFIYAATTGHTDALPMPVLVDTPEVFQRLAQQSGQIALVPTYVEAEVSLATSNGHHVILVSDKSMASRQRPDIELNRIDRRQGAIALQATGLDYRAADRHATHARRNLRAFVRSISKDPRFTHPIWAQPPIAEPIACLTLLGSWTTSDIDLSILAAFSGRTTDDVEALLANVSSADPVFRRVGEQWSLTSPQEAFTLLAYVLAAKPATMKRWMDIAASVLTKSDPTLDPPEEERSLAGLRDVHRQYSAVLRRGVAQGAILLAELGADVALSDGTKLSYFPAALVNKILGEANLDPTGRKWAELSDVLPLLAEAAPQEFLDAVLADLATGGSVIATLFADAGQTHAPIFEATSPHTYLLWALETVCWSDEYLLDGVRILAALAKLDPGGRTQNRPAASLASVLCGRVNNTAATMQQRVNAIRAVRDVDRDVAWELVLALWPVNHAVPFPPSAPYLRPWAPTSQYVPLADLTAFAHAVVETALDLVLDHPSRISRLIEGMAVVLPEDQAKIMDELRRIAVSDLLSAEERFALWDQLYKLLGQHERFRTAARAFEEAVLVDLKAITETLEPKSDSKRFATLFDWHPYLPGFTDDNFEAYETRLTELQRAAIDAVIAGPAPIDALAALAREAMLPDSLGVMCADSEKIPTAAMAGWLVSGEQPLIAAASAWAHRKADGENGPLWLEETLELPSVHGDARLALLRCVPPKRELWTLIERDAAEARFYWQNTSPRFVAPKDVPDVAERLATNGRAWVALTVLANRVHQTQATNNEDTNVDLAALVLDTLEKAIAEEPRKMDVDRMTSEYVGQLMDYLAASGVDNATMGRLEFALIRLTTHERPPRALHALLATQPELFVDLACRVYRGKNEDAGAQDPAKQQLATQASRILRGWNGFPGRTETGEIDRDLLTSWVKQARLLFSESDRSDIGDELIGQALSHSPTGNDGVWPAESVRDLIELIGSRDLENGVVTGRINSRGVTMRNPLEGGTQERALAAEYRSWSDACKASWPRTTRLLRALTEYYEKQAGREDVRAELDADTDY